MQLTKVCANGHHTLIFNISERKLDDYASTNKTIVDWSIQLKTNNGWAYNTVGSTLNLKFGNDVIFNEYKQRSATVGVVTWASGSKEIEHNADGSKTINFECSYSQSSTSSWTPGNATIKDSLKLTTIPRKSSVSATNADIESNTKIEIKRASSSFTHTLKYSFAGLTGTIATKTSELNVSWPVPTSFYAKIPNSKKGTCTITCETYSSNNLIGSSTCTFEASCNETECKPTLTATVIDTNQDTINLTGDSSKLVKYKSTAKITPTATAKNSASISKITIDNVNITSYLSLANVSKNDFEIIATDSRGFSTSLIEIANIVDYVQLTCKANFERTSQTSGEVKLKYSGNYFNGSFGAQNNTLTMSWSYKEKGTDNWISGGILSPTISENTYSGEISCGTNFNYKNDYEFKLYYADELDSLNLTKEVQKGVGSLEVYDKALVANGEDFVTWYDDKLRLGDGLLNAIYPIGSQYITSTNENPSNIFGGTWELIDKEFASQQITLDNNIVSLINANTYSDNTYGFVTLAGHTIRFRLQFNNSIEINDYTHDILSVNLSKIGIANIGFGIFNNVGGSDGGDATFIYDFYNSKLTTFDVISSSRVIPVGANCYCNFVITVKDVDMIDSFCNKFYWKRVS